MDVYEKFLDLCDIKQDRKELLIRTCGCWGVTEEEIGAACERLPQYYRIEFQGIRRLLGLYVREWMHYEELKGSETRKIYFNVPGTVSGMVWLASGLGKNAYAGSPDLVSMVVLYGIIGRREKLDTGSCRHCAVNLMRHEQAEKGLIPAPDIRWSNGLLCDEAPQIDEMLKLRSETSTGPVVRTVTLAKAVKYGEQREYFVGELRRIFEEMKADFGFCPDEEHFREIKKDRFVLALKINQIVQIMDRERKFILGNADLTMIETLLLTVFKCGLKGMISVLDDIIADMKTAADGSNHNYRNIRQRFAVYYTPVCNSEYSRIFEENGIGLLYPTAFKSKAITAKAGNGDPYGEMADECLGMLIGQSAAEEADEISKLINRHDLDGIVLGMFSFDRWLGLQEKILKKSIGAKTGKKVFSYDTDFWNQESFENGRLTTAVETLAAMKEGCLYENNP